MPIKREQQIEKNKIISRIEVEMEMWFKVIMKCMVVNTVNMRYIYICNYLNNLCLEYFMC